MGVNAPLSETTRYSPARRFFISRTSKAHAPDASNLFAYRICAQKTLFQKTLIIFQISVVTVSFSHNKNCKANEIG